MSKNKLLSTSIVYFVASIAVQVINLVLISIYTNNMTMGQYGEFNLIISYQGLLSIIVILGIYSGLSRFYKVYEDKNLLKNTALTFSLIWGTIVTIIAFALSNPLASLLFGRDPDGPAYIMYITITSILVCFVSIYTTYFSMQYKAVKSSMANSGKIVLTLVFTVYLMVRIKGNILGALQAQTLAYGMVFLVLLLGDIKNVRLVIKKEPIKNMLSFGMAMAPGQISTWVLNLIDRTIIDQLMGNDATGMYSAGYKIGNLVDPVLTTPFRSAFTPYKFDVYNEEDGKDKIRKVYNYYNFLGWFVITGLSLFASIALEIFTPSPYWSVFKMVPLIAFSYYLWGLVEFYGIGIQIANKMIISSAIIAFSAIMNVILNYILVPRWGIYGAAAATIVCYFIVNVLYYFAGKKYYNLRFNLFEPFKYVIVFIVVYGLYMLGRVYIHSIIIEFLFCSALCVLYLLLNVLFGFVSKDSIKAMIAFIKTKGKANSRKSA